LASLDRPERVIDPPDTESTEWIPTLSIQRFRGTIVHGEASSQEEPVFRTRRERLLEIVGLLTLAAATVVTAYEAMNMPTT
jgi:hypothetical protein